MFVVNVQYSAVTMSFKSVLHEVLNLFSSQPYLIGISDKVYSIANE